MKTSTTTLVFAIGLVAIGGLFGSTIFGITGTKSNMETSTAATGLITGHVVTTLTDSDGNVVAYRQSDNIIVNNGENCVAKLLFQGSTGAAGTNVCTGSNTTGFRFIAIGTGTGAAAADNVGLGAARTDGTLAPKAATVTWTNSTGSGTTQATVALSTTFTNDSGGTVAIAESGLFNSTSVNTGGMFARQQFSAVNMNNNDQLTVTWTVNIGGTGTFN
jgi:hypothetical protein